MAKYILSFDLGTTAIKAALYDTNGRVIAKTTQEYELIVPSPLFVEQEPDVYWDAIKKAVRTLLDKAAISADNICCIGVSAQGETLIPVDKEGVPVRRAIVWLDNRAHEEAEIIAQHFTKDELYKRTGQVEMCATWPAAKIFWMRRHEPELFKKTAKFLLIEDWFIYKLTGAYVAEGSLLCSTTYWDIRSRTWWDEMLDFLGISEEQLPKIVEPGEVIGPIKVDAARELGLSTDTIVVAGGLDQACGALGVGLGVGSDHGVISENTGAALAMCGVVDHPFMDPNRLVPCFYYVLPGMYMAHSFTTGGMVLRWFRDKFCQEEMSVSRRTGSDAYDLLTQEAARISPGSEGLVVLPHFQGAGAPESNAKAKGVLYGLTLRHTKAHVIRAIMESLGYAMRRLIEAFKGVGIDATEIRALGGGAKSRLWMQIKADITGLPVIASKNPDDAACLGAAILAGVATGVWGNIEQAVAEAVALESEPIRPNPGSVAVYEQLYNTYVKLYEKLCPLFSES